MKIKKCFVIIMVLGLVLSCFAGCDAEPDREVPGAAGTFLEGMEVQMPVVLQEMIVGDMATVGDYAGQLSGQWGDDHAALMESGLDASSSQYADLKAVLDGFREECGAYYVYAMVPADDGAAGDDFLITVDGSEEPDDFLANYGWEVQFTEAWEGAVTSARSAWNDSEHDPVWSTFAPIKNSAGDVVAILGIDFPSSEVRAYQEWNRDSEDWNGIEE